MSAILDDDEDVLAGLEKGERKVVINPRELALQAIEDGRIREFETESGLKVRAQPAINEDMDPDDVAAEQERARLEAVADGKAANTGATRGADHDNAANADQLQRQVQDAAPTVIDNFDNVLVKRKVNGVEETVPLADVMRTHQKAAAADQRLEEATRLLREAEARRLRRPRRNLRRSPHNRPCRRTPPPTSPKTSPRRSSRATRRRRKNCCARHWMPGHRPRRRQRCLPWTFLRKLNWRIAVKGAMREFQRDRLRLVEDPELATLSEMRINS